MSKKNPDQELMKHCAKLVEEAGELAGMKKIEHLKKPCGLVIFVFSEKRGAIIASGKINPTVIAEFLVADCGLVVADPPMPMAPHSRMRSAAIN